MTANFCNKCQHQGLCKWEEKYEELQLKIIDTIVVEEKLPFVVYTKCDLFKSQQLDRNPDDLFNNIFKI